MGESALKSHMRSKRHKNNGTIGGEPAVTLYPRSVLYHVEMEIQVRQEKRENDNPSTASRRCNSKIANNFGRTCD